MADKVLDWTNVIGKNFFSYVTSQLKTRGEILRKGSGADTFAERSNSDLMWLTNRNGWIRVTSNINIKAGNPLSSKYGSGDALAKKYILQGGVVYANASLNNGSVLRSGIGTDKAYGVGYKSSDPGSVDIGMGLKPMPGITSFNISADGPYGALKTANIKIKAFDLEQFNIIETLYCHLGLSLVAEFGHVPYVDNTGKLITNVSSLDIFNLKDKEQVAAQITAQRKTTCGNYDAIFGTVTNYSWTSNNDGSYDIDLKVIGPGSIVESININYSTSNSTNPLNPSTLPIYQEFLRQNQEAVQAASTPPPSSPAPSPTSGNTTPAPATGTTTVSPQQLIEAGAQAALQSLEKQLLPGVIASRNNSVIHRHLYSLYENALSSQQVSNPAAGGGGDTAIRSTTTPTLTNNIFTSNSSYNFLKTAGGLTGNVLALKGNNAALISNPSLGNSVPTIDPNLFRYYTIAFVTNPEQGQETNSNATTKDQLPKVYIPFGYFLAILQCSGMVYNSSKGDTKADATKPLVYIDFNNKTNYCFSYPWSVSIDPNICLINIANGTDLNKWLFGGVTIDGEQILKPTYSQIQADNQYDPGADILSKKIAETSNKFYDSNNKAFLMNVLLNIEYIVGKMDSLAGTAPDKFVKLDKFLNEILSDINNSLGGVNEFRVALNDESYCIQLMDEQRLDQPDPAVIDVIGLSSIVQNYSFQSKISPKLASMMVIGAQGGNVNKKQAGIDASAIGKWNEFVEDRIMPTKVDSTDSEGGSNNAPAAAPATAEGQAGQAESPDDQLSRHIKGIYQNFKYSESDIEGARKLLNEKLLAIKANLNETTAVSLIPLEMSITMDGISGILINQTFVIPPERLPLSYQEKIGGKGTTKLGFIVRKIENSVQNNRWLTTISGQSINLPKAVRASVVKIDPLPQKPTPSPAASTGGTTPPSTTDPTVQRQEQENLQRITVPNSGKNTTANTYTYIPKTSNKAVDVFIFYPGINVGGKVGRDYMPQKVTAAAPDWFDKYVLVFPTTWTTSYSTVKREYEDLLTKAGLTVRTLNIGIYSGSGNNTASVLSALRSSGRELKNFIMMDPVPSANLVKAVDAIKTRGGTAQYLYYNTAVWGGASYYGGVDSKGQLYGPIKNLVDAGTGKVAITKTAIGHYDIPTAILKAYKSQIEQYLG